MLELLHERAWLWISAGLYFAAFISSIVTMLRAHSRSHALLLIFVLAGLTAQTVGLYLRGLEVGGCPVSNKFEVVQFVIWSFTVLYVIVRPAFQVSMLGFFTSALATLLSVISLLVGRWDVPGGEPVFGGAPWIEAHASLALFSYGAFGTLAITSLMFLLQTFSLKRKHLSGLFSFLPSIVALEKINFRLLVTGLSVLSGALALGAIYYHREPDSITGAKLLIATAVWSAYFVVFILRITRRLVSNGLAWTCLILFGAALLSLGPINAGSRPADPNAIETPRSEGNSTALPSEP